jgi:hypothetical protein
MIPLLSQERVNLLCCGNPDVQGPDLEVVHADAFMQDMQIPEVFQETSEVQERPSSVWDRLGVQDNERPIRDEVFERVVRDNDRGEEETHKSFLNGARINSEYSEHRPRWTKGPERNNRNGSRRIYLGGMQQNFKFGLGENDQLPDATPNGLEQGLPLQVAIYSRNQIWLDRHPLQSYNPTYDTCGISPTNDNGMFAKRDFEQVDDGKAALYAQLNPNVKLCCVMPSTWMIVSIIAPLKLLLKFAHDTLYCP